MRAMRATMKKPSATGEPADSEEHTLAHHQPKSKRQRVRHKLSSKNVSTKTSCYYRFFSVN